MTPEQLNEQLTQADGETKKGNYGLAIKSAEEVLSEIISSEVLSTELAEIKANAMLSLATAYGKQGVFDNSIELANQTLALAEEFQFTIINSKAWNLLGNAYQRLSEFNKSIEYYEKAIATYIDLEEKTGLARVLGNIGSVYVYISAYEKALEHFEKALATHIELEDKSGMASATCNIGIVHDTIGDFSKAIEYFETALSNYMEQGDKSGLAIVTANLGSVHKKIGSYDKALEYFEIACAKHYELGETRHVASVTSKIASVYVEIGMYEKSLELYEKARALYHELGDKNGIAIVTGNIGGVYYNLGSYAIALENHISALFIHKELGNKAGAAYVAQSISNDYCVLRQYDESLNYGHDALNLAEDIGDKSLMGYCWVSIGNTLSAIGRTEESMIYFKKALDLRSNELNTLDGVADNLLAIGTILIAENKLDEAFLIIDEALKTATELGEKRYVMEAHQSLATLYEKLHNPIKELEHFKLYHTLEKEVLSEEAKKKAEHIEQLKRIAEREKEIEIAKATANAKLSATTSLLHRVLPESIASRILAGEEQIADFIPNVSILFADMVGFTTIATDVPPDIIVALLNHVFDIFDQIMKKHGCEKVKTMGDGYMAVAGAPIECKDHAERIARAALDMMADIRLPEGIDEFLPSGTRFQIRIGIHTGGAVCGVMGRDRFIWDVYSDAVNIASRMESSGVAGKIQVSKDFVRYMRSRAKSGGGDEFTFSERGEMEIKGKGMMKTYFLEKV